jgi:GNAT superfamily N-acetyltransferase
MVDIDVGFGLRGVARGISQHERHRGRPADDPVLIAHYLASRPATGRATKTTCRMRRTSQRNSSRKAGRSQSMAAFSRSLMARSLARLCCLLRSPYPDVVKQERRLRGYIFSVFTVPSYRGTGVRKALTERAIAHLQNVGCTHIVLHASDAGAPLYEKLGFGRPK